METKDLLQKVRRIEIKTKGLSKQIFSGEYNSAFKGKGMSFSEVRAYQYGDDVRNIDWNVTARTGEPHVKIFEEERELTVMLLLDLSGSSFFGTKNGFKSDILLEISALLSFAAINNNDKVGAIIFTDRIEKFIPPKKGKQHILYIIRELINIQPAGKKTNLGLALKYFSNIIKRRSICFLISDFMDQEYQTSFKVASRKHDLIGIRLFDPMEELLPEVGLIPIIDNETGKKIWLDTSSSQIQLKFNEGVRKKNNYLEKVIQSSKADLLTIPTNADYVKILMDFFQKRTAS
ncbi:MAG: hypothetical protein RJA52_714 [Bacteroidota bacterium]|jgi:uncharacterized protein (DUF58 family)